VDVSFDSIPKDKLLERVMERVGDGRVLGLIDSWLQQDVMHDMERWTPTSGTRVERSKGTPQGGVVSPVLANLFLHYAFDAWMARECPDLPWCRYADDGLVHCRSEAEAIAVKAKLAARLTECHLDLHPDKTRIIYCKDGNRRRKYPNTKFDFLGYTFGPTDVKNRERKEVFTSFSPRVSSLSIKNMRRVIRELNLRRCTHIELADIAQEINPILQGWLNYYGRYSPAAMDPVWHYVNATLVAWVRRKYKRYNGKKERASLLVKFIANKRRRLFVHWRRGYTGSFA